MISPTPKKTWCEQDDHASFHKFTDFNNWLDTKSNEALLVLNTAGIGQITHPAKSLFAGDRNAYNLAFKEFHNNQLNEALGKSQIEDIFDDLHWFDQNKSRLDQLLKRLTERSVVPFIGAGISVDGGFSTWKDHLRTQGKTAGIENSEINTMLDKGEYEEIIAKIEEELGTDVFAQQIRDDFSRTGEIKDVTLRISELFTDTLITTNYDTLLEQVYDTGDTTEVEVLSGSDVMNIPSPNKITVIKIHGNVNDPHKCILGKTQYDDAYGAEKIDLIKAIPKVLKYHYINSTLLFLGCSLNNDRTIDVFKAIKSALGEQILPQHFAFEQIPEASEEIVLRNSELLRLGITPIWFPPKEYHKVEEILRYAHNDLSYQETLN